MGLHSFKFPARIVLVILSSALIFGGCASTVSNTASVVHKIHSLTPCGMVMGGIMKHGQHNDMGNTDHHESEPEEISSVNTDKS